MEQCDVEGRGEWVYLRGCISETRLPHCHIPVTGSPCQRQYLLHVSGVFVHVGYSLFLHISLTEMIFSHLFHINGITLRIQQYIYLTVYLGKYFILIHKDFFTLHSIPLFGWIRIHSTMFDTVCDESSKIKVPSLVTVILS